MKLKKLLALLLALAMVLTSMSFAVADAPAEDPVTETAPEVVEVVDEQVAEEAPAEAAPAEPVVVEESAPAEDASAVAADAAQAEPAAAEAPADTQEGSEPAADEHENEYFTVTFDCGDGTLVDAPAGVIAVPGSNNHKFTKAEIPWGSTVPSSIEGKNFDAKLDGYGFGGWFKDSAKTKEFKFDQDQITADITLYAKFDPYGVNYKFVVVGAVNNNYQLSYDQKWFTNGETMEYPVFTSEEWDAGDWAPATTTVEVLEPDAAERTETLTVTHKKFTVYKDLGDGAIELATNVEYGTDYEVPAVPAADEIAGREFQYWQVNGVENQKYYPPITADTKYTVTSDTTFKAITEGLEFPVRFEGDGVTTPVDTTVNYGEKLVEKKDVELDEHVYGGWKVRNAGDSGLTAGDPFVFDSVFGTDVFAGVTTNEGLEPLVLEPIWDLQTYRVTFYGYEDEEIDTADIGYGEAIGAAFTTKIPTRPGYEFVKWVDADGKEVTAATVIYTTTRVDAEWKAIEYSLNLNQNGHNLIKYADGTPFTATITGVYGDTVTLKDLAETDQGQHFKGWLYHNPETDKDEVVTEWTFGTSGVVWVDNQVVDDPDGLIIADLTADWANFFTVTFEAEKLGIEPVEVLVDEEFDEEEKPIQTVKLPESLKDLASTDDVFFSGKWIANVNPSIIPQQGQDDPPYDVTNALKSDAGLAIRRDVTISADLYDLHTITFDPCGGEIVEGPESIKAAVGLSYREYMEALGETVTEPEAEKKGYGFGGWHTATEGGGDYFDYNSIIDEDLETVYAAWWPMNWKVTYIPNGGTLSGNPEAWYHSGDKVEKPTDPTRDGYIFDGWYLYIGEDPIDPDNIDPDDLAEEKFDFENSEILEDLNLVAVWVEAEAKIGKTLYKTLADAAKAAKAGDVVEPIKDIEIYEPEDGPVFTVDATLDLGNFTVALLYDDVAIKATAGTLTIKNKNGTIEGGQIVASGSGKIVIDSGNYDDVKFSGSITVNDGEFTTVVPATFSEGALINGGKFYIDPATPAAQKTLRIKWFDAYLKTDSRNYLLKQEGDAYTEGNPYTLVPYYTLTYNWLDDADTIEVFEVPDDLVPDDGYEPDYAAYALTHEEWVASNNPYGWFLEDTFVSEFNPETKLNKDTEVFFKWVKVIKVTFVDNTKPNATVFTASYEEGKKIPSDDDYADFKAGYVERADRTPSDERLFDYWTLDGEKITYTDIEKIEVTEPLTFVAQYDIEVTYDADGGYFDDNQEERTLVEYIPYNTEANNYSEDTADHQVYKDNFEFDNWYLVDADGIVSENPWNFKKKLTEDTKFVAEWKHNTSTWDINKVLTDFADSEDLVRIPADHTEDQPVDTVVFGAEGETITINKFSDVVAGKLPDKEGYYFAVQVMAPCDLQMVEPDSDDLWRVKVGGKWYDFNTEGGKADGSYYPMEGYLVMNIYEQVSPSDLKAAANEKTFKQFDYLFAKKGDEKKAANGEAGYKVTVELYPENVVFMDGDNSTYRITDWEYAFDVSYTAEGATNEWDQGEIGSTGYENPKEYESGTSAAEILKPIEPDWTDLTTDAIVGKRFDGWSLNTTLHPNITRYGFAAPSIVEEYMPFTVNWAAEDVVVFWGVQEDATPDYTADLTKDELGGYVYTNPAKYTKFLHTAVPTHTYADLAEYVPEMPEKIRYNRVTYVFGGWVLKEYYEENKDAIGQSKLIKPIEFEGNTTPISGNIEFVPVYKQLATITFWESETAQLGGYTQEVARGTLKLDLQIPDESELTIPEGTLFDGWYIRNADGSIGEKELWTVAPTAIYKDYNYVAQYAPKATVTFMDGEKVVDSQDFFAGRDIIDDIEVPDDLDEEEGFLFWALAEDTTRQKYSFRKNAAESIDEDLTFVAVWEDTFSIVFMDEDGTILATKNASPWTTLADIYEEPEESEIKVFLGWFEKNGEIIADEPTVFDDTKVTKNMTFIAMYEQVREVWFEPALSIDEAIGMRVYIHIPEDDDPADYTVTRVYHSKYQDLDDTYTVGDLDWNLGWLLRISENASDEMSDEATVTVYYKGEEVAKDTFSIRSIAYDWLDQGKNVGILNAMLQYGAKAQVQFGNKADDLPVAPNPPALVAIPDTYAVSGDPTTLDEYITLDSGLNLESRVFMRFYFKPAEGLGVDDFEFSVKDKNGKGAKFSKPEMKNGEIVIEVSNIDPNEMANEYSITVNLKSDTSKTATWKRSVLNNAYKLQQKGVAGDLLKALYQYYLEANKLFGN